MRSSSANPSWSDPPPPEPRTGGIEHLIRRLQQQVAGGELTRDAALKHVAAYVQALTNADGAAIASSDNGHMVCRASLGSAPDVGVTLRPDAGLSGECIRSARPAICNDTGNDSRVDAEAATALGVRSILVVPVIDHGEVAGLVEVFAATSNSFDARHLAALQRLATGLPRLIAPPPGTDDTQQPAERLSGLPPVAAATAPDQPQTAPAEGESPSSAGSEALGPGLFDESAATGSNWRRVALIAGSVLLLLALLIVLAWRSVSGASADPAGSRSIPPDPEVLFSRAKELIAGSSADCRPAVELLRQAAQAGHLIAQYELGLHARRPECGADAPESARWLLVAAERGHPQAQREYAAALAEGRGVARDRVSAYAWHVLAQQGGDSLSEPEIRRLTKQMSDREILRVRTRLGSMYAQGTGTARDYVRAYMWFALAQAGGDPAGAQLRDQIARSMTPEQVEAARRRTDEWLRRHPRGERTRIAASPQ